MHQFRTRKSAASDLCWPKTNNGGAKIDGDKNMFFGHNSKLLKPQSWDSWSNRNSKACIFHLYKRFGCAPPNALLYETTFSQNSKVEQRQIEILVNISICVEHVQALLPTLGRSANLNEPRAPRKDTSRSFVFLF